MSSESEQKVADAAGAPCVVLAQDVLRQELGHLKTGWWWLLFFGILLIVGGTVALLFPILTNVAAMVVLGVTLVMAGIATIVTAFWAGKWGGFLVQFLVGIVYFVVGLQIADMPLQAGLVTAMFIAAFFIVAGAFRVAAALTVRFPHWGWAMLNGVVTFLCGVVIYRHFPQCALWVVGLLVGLEMIFNGLTWIMLAVAIRNIPDKAA